jgi:hypothetical protein
VEFVETTDYDHARQARHQSGVLRRRPRGRLAVRRAVSPRVLLVGGRGHPLGRGGGLVSGRGQCHGALGRGPGDRGDARDRAHRRARALVVTGPEVIMYPYIDAMRRELELCADDIVGVQLLCTGPTHGLV